MTDAVSLGKDPTYRVVVGVDGSAGSKRALAWSLDEAGLHRGACTAVIAWTSLYSYLSEIPVPIDEGDERDAAAGRLEEAIAQVLEAGPSDWATVPLEREVLEGDPVGVLLKRCETLSARLLVVGSRGVGGFKGLMLGSVSARLTHHASCPVVVIRGRS
jgi:nucleotide-binding universal stress UspA family protein